MKGPIIEIRNMTRGKAPRVPFKRIVGDILPKRYRLSLCLCGDTLSRRMNRTYRKKTYVPNVLSFPLRKYEGEIFLNVRKAGHEARVFGVSPRDRVALLFVHGCFHLFGLKHGDKMERLEKQVLKKFGFKTV